MKNHDGTLGCEGSVHMQSRAETAQQFELQNARSVVARESFAHWTELEFDEASIMQSVSDAINKFGADRFMRAMGFGQNIQDVWVNFDLRDISYSSPGDESGWVQIDWPGYDENWRVGEKPLLARHISEWHEDDGPVMWWAWNGEQRQWAGEPAWIGSPLENEWPGYHTHWTKHPVMPVYKSQTE